MRVKVLTFLILLVLTLTALGQGVDNKTGQATPVDDNSGGWFSVYTFAFLVGIILAVFAGVLLYFNMISAHKHLTEMQTSLDGFIQKHADKIDEDSLIQIIHECVNADPSGAPGTTRGVMALTITLIVGIALFFLVAYKPAEPTNTSIKEVLLTLTGALTTIIGFYFGGKGTETAPTSPKASETKEKNPSEVPKAEAPKPKLYDIEENFTYGDKQYNKGEKKVDLSNIPVDILNGWVESKKVVPYVGDEKVERDKELKDRPGWYKIKTDFHYQDDLYISGNIMNLTNVPASILDGWKKNNWVEPYTGPVA